ncbi:MAG: hypothetical protein FH758_06180 [Firmicutes bacterium]|nr:hypothetical protein [Bacillota bacterium]
MKSKLLNKKYLVGPILIELEGSGELFKLIDKEFKVCEKSNQKELADLKIKILNPEQKISFDPKYYSLSGNIAFDNNSFLKVEKGYSYLVKNLFDFSSNTEVTISYSEKQNMVSLLKNILLSLPTGFSNKGIQIKNSIMSYTLFWYLFHIVLLKKNSTFIHSSITDKNSKGIVIAGTGGCGKTSTTFKLLENDTFKYLSEDFGIITIEGKAHYNPKFTSIYSSDVRYGQKHLVKYVDEKMSKSDKVLWNSYKTLGGNPIRKIAPVDLLGEEKLKDETLIEQVYFFARSNNDEIHIEEITNDELADRAVNASFRELNFLFELLANVHAVGYMDTQFPNLSEIKEKTKAIYKEAFKNAQKKLVYVPLKSTPDKIINKLDLLN